VYDTYEYGDFIHMRGALRMKTTMNLNMELIKKAMEVTKIKEKTALVHAALEALIADYARKRLAALGGTDRTARAPSRKRAS
jgi:Arc/MetJ family transcription regulator